jgi:hypothetical protein
MAKSRSPSYPAIGLKEALSKVSMVYERNHMNKLSKATIAEHMGYKSLSGASLPILSALNQFGLLEGRGDETRVSETALNIMAHEPGASDRFTALRTAAYAPDLFGDLARRFQGRPSDAAVRSYLLTQRFIPSAAEMAVRSYRETIDLLSEEEEAYKRVNPEAAFQTEFTEMLQDTDDKEAFRIARTRRSTETLKTAPAIEQKGLQLMEGERELTTGLLSKGASFRLIVSGKIGEKEIDILIRKLALDKEILADQDDEDAGVDKRGLFD